MLEVQTIDKPRHAKRDRMRITVPTEAAPQPTELELDEAEIQDGSPPPPPSRTPAEIIEAMLDKAVELGRPIAEVVDVDSAFAEELLNRDRRNRPLSKSRIQKIRRDAAQGHFQLNGQTLVIASDGSFNDGQHRASAIAGTPHVISTFLVVGVRPESRATMDQGKPRSAGDILRMEGEGNGITEAAIARLLIAYDKNERLSVAGAGSSTNAQVIDFFEKHADDIRASAKLVTAMRETARYYVASSTLGFVHYLTHKIDPELADTYARQIAKGQGLVDTDAAYIIRERLLKLGRIGVQAKLELLMGGWNAIRQQRDLSKAPRLTGKLPNLV